MTNLTNTIQHKLEETFCPTHLEIIDESHKHAGHAGVAETGGYHLDVTIVSDKFLDLNTVKRHRLVYTILATEMANNNRNGIHALALKTFTQDEWNEKNG